MQISVTIISLFDLSGVTIFRDVILFILYVIKPYPILNVFSNVKFQYPALPLVLEIYFMQHLFPCNAEKRKVGTKACHNKSDHPF